MSILLDSLLEPGKGSHGRTSISLHPGGRGKALIGFGDQQEHMYISCGALVKASRLSDENAGVAQQRPSFKDEASVQKLPGLQTTA